MALPPLYFTRESDVDNFVRLFLTKTLPKAHWNHNAHLVVGLWHVLNHPRDKAMLLLRGGIRQYNEATGTANTNDAGYHETWTYFFVQALAAYAETRASSHDRLRLYNELSTSRLSDKHFVLFFYTRSLITSTGARLSLVEPDARPLTDLAEFLDPARMAGTPYYLRRASREDAPHLLKLITALAEFEKLDPPDEAAQARLVEDAFGPKPRFEPWLAFADRHRDPVAYAIFLETYSSFLALPTLYIEDIFVLPDFRKRGIGKALLRQAIELAHTRNCGRVEWTALDWNINAQRIYEQKLGAKHMSEWFLYRMTQKEITAYLHGKVA